MYSRNTANGRGRGIIPPYNYGGTVYSRALRDAQEEAKAAEEDFFDRLIADSENERILSQLRRGTQVKVEHIVKK